MIKALYLSYPFINKNFDFHIIYPFLLKGKPVIPGFAYLAAWPSFETTLTTKPTATETKRITVPISRYSFPVIKEMMEVMDVMSQVRNEVANVRIALKIDVLSIIRIFPLSILSSLQFRISATK